jgi:hypothetical protein
LCRFRVGRREDHVFAGYVYLPAQVSLIPTALSSERAVVTDFHGEVTAANVPSTMAPGESMGIDVQVSNKSEQDWAGDHFRPVHLAYRWQDVSGQQPTLAGNRIGLPAGQVAAGHAVSVHVELVAPAVSAAYELILTLVQEHVAWFDDSEPQFRPARHPIIVHAGSTQPSGLCNGIQ